MCSIVLALPVLLSALVDPPAESQWTAFRGPDRSGVAPDSSIPASFDAEGAHRWRTELPPGYSSPVVAKGLVFVTGVDGKELVTFAIDEATGAVRWRRSVEHDGRRVGGNSSASSTPATDGERVYSLFHHVGLVAYDLEGEELWRNDLGAPFSIPHGLSTSPVLYEGKLFVQIDQDLGSRLVALDARTGKVVWEVPRPGPHGYSTPVVHEPEEGPAQLITAGAFRVTAYSVDDGAELWWAGGCAWQVKAAPILWGDLCIVNAYMAPTSDMGMPKVTQSWEEMLAEKDANEDGFIQKSEWDEELLQAAWFVFDLTDDDKLDEADFDYIRSAGAATGALLAIRLGGKGDVTETHVAWRCDDRRAMTDFLSPLVVDGTVFLLRDNGVLTTLDAATGEVLERGRVGEPGQYFSSPVAAGGRLLTASNAGVLTALDAKPEWKVVSSHALGEELWATPAIDGELVLVRSQSALHCFGPAPAHDEPR